MKGHGRADREEGNGAWRFAGAGFALAALAFGSNEASGLYPLYQRRFGFSSLTVTLIFATTAWRCCPR